MKRRVNAEREKEERNVFKCLVCEQLHEGLSTRPEHLRGITDVIPISRLIGLENNDFLAFHEITTEAAGNLELTRLFDYADAKAKTFVASAEYTARFQSYLTEG